MSQKRAAPMRQIGKALARAAIGAAVQYPSTRNLMAHAGVSASSGRTISVTGTDFLQAVATTTAVAAGDTLVTHMFHMGSIAASRLAKFAQLYENYRVERLQFHFESAVATSYAGSYVMFFDYDPTDAALTGGAQLNNAYGHSSNVSGKWYESQSLTVPMSAARRQDLLCTPPDGSYADDPRDYAFGRFNLVAANSVASGSAGALGNLFVTYKVVFSNPAYHQPLGASFINDFAVTPSDNAHAPLPIVGYQTYNSGETLPGVPLDSINGPTGASWTWLAKPDATIRTLADAASGAADCANRWLNAANSLVGTALTVGKLVRNMSVLWHRTGLDDVADNTDTYATQDVEYLVLPPGSYRITYSQWLCLESTDKAVWDYYVVGGLAGSSATGELRMGASLTTPTGEDPAVFYDYCETFADSAVTYKSSTTTSGYVYGVLQGVFSCTLKKAAAIRPIFYYNTTSTVGVTMFGKHNLSGRYVRGYVSVNRVDPSSVGREDFHTTALCNRRFVSSNFPPCPPPDDDAVLAGSNEAQPSGGACAAAPSDFDDYDLSSAAITPTSGPNAGSTSSNSRPVQRVAKK